MVRPRTLQRAAALLGVASALSCNQLLGIEGASVGCVSDVHCGPSESCLASVCQTLRPEDAGAFDAGDAASDAAPSVRGARER
jgi:hypothetical protein